MNYTQKQRMLNTYKGIFSDRYPVAPEFWYYYPAKVLGVDMIEFERNVPHHVALKATFEKYGTEGWGCSFPNLISENPIPTKEKIVNISDSQFHIETTQIIDNKEFKSIKAYDKNEPSWVVEYPCKDPYKDFETFMKLKTPKTINLDVKDAIDAYNYVGDSYLNECFITPTYFDLIGNDMGFQEAIMFFMDEDNEKLLSYYHEKYMEYLKEYIKILCPLVPYEAFFIGCGWSCNSLIGPNLWRKWDKPIIKLVAEELHKQNRLLHIHLHGKVYETIEDLVDTTVDCVCPFERAPGGDISDLTDLRNKLNNKVCVNGNVHTVETLIRGDENAVRKEVREILNAFKGSPRLIVGTGDQVGLETTEDNIYAMIDEVKKFKL